MAIEFNGKTIATNANGYLDNLDDWSEELAKAMADADELELTEKHWDVINYLREEYFNNGGNQPNERTIIKDMKKLWGKKPSSKDMYNLFPGTPSKQAGKIGGLPETRRKGGY